MARITQVMPGYLSLSIFNIHVIENETLGISLPLFVGLPLGISVFNKV
jgi:hypothetical protein